MAVKKSSTPKVDRDLMMRQNGYITVAEVARKMGVDDSRVYRWLDEGKIQGERVLNKRYVSLKSLVKHLGEGTARIFGFIKKEAAEEKT